jgi:hypothetical protein
MNAHGITIVSPLSLRDLLSRLAAFGKEWRESKLPESVRKAGYFGCEITVEGATFTLSLEPQGRGPLLVWRGIALSREAPEPGSEVRLRWELTPMTIASYGIAVPFLAWVAWNDSLVGALFLGAGVLVISGLSAQWRADQQAAHCRAILTALIGKAV